MATRIRIDETGRNTFVIHAPDVRIPFRGTRDQVARAAKQLAAMIGTAFSDVELNVAPRKTSVTASHTRRGGLGAPSTASRKASWWDRLHARNRATGITAAHLDEDTRDFERIAREARDIDRTVTRLKKRDKTVKPAKRSRRK